MKVIIAGSRTITDMSLLEKAIDESGYKIIAVLSGMAEGVDKLGEEWARKNVVSLFRYPADWNKYGRSAGMKRNVTMATDADALIAVWDGYSKGTKHMIETAHEHGLKVWVKDISQQLLFDIPDAKE